MLKSAYRFIIRSIHGSCGSPISATARNPRNKEHVGFLAEREDQYRAQMHEEEAHENASFWKDVQKQTGQMRNGSCFRVKTILKADCSRKRPTISMPRISPASLILTFIKAYASWLVNGDEVEFEEFAESPKNSWRALQRNAACGSINCRTYRHRRCPE